MKKLTLSVNLLLIANLFLTFFFPQKVFANFVADDGGVQKFHTQNVPQINSSGKIQNSYTSDSFFPLALYWSDTRYLQQIKGAGFNTISSAIWNPSPHHTYLSDLDQLNQYGIKVIQQIQDYVAGSVSQNNWGILQNKINAYKNNPAVLAWYFDEMATRYATPAQLSEAYTRIKALDPNRAIMAEAGIRGGAGPTGIPFTVDMSNIYSYNVYSEIWSLQDLPYSIDLYMGRPNPWPLFVILQAFKQGNDVPWAAWKVMPTPDQIRAQMYTAITHGATGLWLFLGFPDENTRNKGEKLTGLTPDIPQWNAASQANHEIEANKQIFLSKTAGDEYHVFVQKPSVNCPPNINCKSAHPLQTILKDAGEAGVRYLLAVNQDYYGLEGKFTFGQNPTRITSVLDNRSIVPAGSGFTDSFGGYGVRLYKIESGSPGRQCNRCSSVNGCERVQFTNQTNQCDTPDTGVNVIRTTDCSCTRISGGDNSRCNSCLPSSTPTPTPIPIPGDLNHDGRVDILDLRQLISNFTTIFDYNLVVGNFGKQ